MQLSGNDPAVLSFITGALNANAKAASYDVCADKIIVFDEDKKKEPKAVELKSGDFILQPQHTCIIVSKEKIKIPTGFVAYAHPKTGLCQKGLLVLSTGIIDPGYEGLVSTTAINFAKDQIAIREGDKFLRLVFHELKPHAASSEAAPAAIAEADYIKARLCDATRYPQTFLDIPNHFTRLKETIIKDVLSVADARVKWIVAAIALVFTVTNVWLSIKDKHNVENHLTEIHDIATAAAGNFTAIQQVDATLLQQASTVAAARADIDNLKKAKTIDPADFAMLQARLTAVESAQKELDKHKKKRDDD